MTEVNNNKNKLKAKTSNQHLTATCVYQPNSGVITTYLNSSSALILFRNFTSFLTTYQNISWILHYKVPSAAGD